MGVVQALAGHRDMSGRQTRQQRGEEEEEEARLGEPVSRADFEAAVEAVAEHGSRYVTS